MVDTAYVGASPEISPTVPLTPQFPVSAASAIASLPTYGKLAGHQIAGMERTLKRWGAWAQYMERLYQQGDPVRLAEGWAGGGRLLAWDMGAGKTFAALSLIRVWRAWLPTLGIRAELQQLLLGPILIISQARGRHVWEKETQKWYPESASEIVTPLTGTDLKLAALGVRAGLVDVLSTSYTALALNPEYLQGLKFGLCIMDEVHELGNASTQKARAIHNLMALDANAQPGLAVRLGLSGTPTTNKPDKLWPVLATLNGIVYRKAKTLRLYSPHWAWGTRTEFEANYCEMVGTGNLRRALRGRNLVHDPDRYPQCRNHPPEKCNNLHNRMLRVCMDRVPRQEAWASLPEAVPQWEPVELSPYQKDLYDYMVRHEVLPAVESGQLRQGQVERMALMTYAFEAADSTAQIAYSMRNKYGPKAYAADKQGRPLPLESSKIDWLIDFMEQLDDEAAVLVFAEYAQFAGEIAHHPRLAHYQPLLLAGTSSLTTKRAEELFQAPDSPHRLLVATTKGTTVLTLTRASYVVIAGKLSWSPIDYLQAVGRIRRPGQKASHLDVRVLYAPDTIEGWLRGKLAVKLEDQTAILDGKTGGADELGIGSLTESQFIDAFFGK